MSYWTNVAFNGVGAKGASGTSSVTLGAPSSPVVNDMWIAVIHSSDNATISFTDWTQIVQGNGGGTDSRLSVWYHRYAGVTPNLTATRTGTSGDAFIGGIAVFQGVKPGGTPVHVNSTISTGTDGSIEHTGVTITQRGCALLAINGSADDNNRTALGGRWISAFDEAGTLNYETTLGTVDGSVALSYDLDAFVAATGTVTQTQDASDQWAGVLIALSPRVDIDPTSSNLTLSTSAPLVTVSATPRAVVYSAVVRAVTVQNTTITPARVDLLLSTAAPAVVRTDNHARTPAQGNLTLSFFAPTRVVSDNHMRTPAQGNLTLSTTAPTDVQNIIRTPAQGNLTLTTVAPTDLQDDPTVPAQGNLALSTTAPVVVRTDNHARSPAQGNLTLSFFAPTAVTTVNTTVTPAQGNLTLSEVTPEVMLNAYLRPAADVTDGGWTDQDGGTSLFAAIDEGVINDADYIQSSGNPAADICTIALSDPVVTLTQPFEVRYRYKKSGTGQIDLTVRLMETAVEIAEWVHTDISTTFVTANQPLTGPQFAAITNMNNLRIEFEANSGGFSPLDFGADLVAWYDANEGVYVDAGSTLATDGQTVQQWNDQSGNGNNLSQATSGQRPTFDTTGLNSLKAVVFSAAASTWLRGVTNAADITGTAVSVFVVGQMNTATPGNGRCVSFAANAANDYGNTASWTFTRSSSGDFIRLTMNTPDALADGAITLDTEYRLGFTLETGEAIVYVNNVADGTDTADVAPNFTVGTLAIGEMANANSDFWDGPISEVVIVKRVLTTQERNDLDAYFVAKWGF